MGSLLINPYTICIKSYHPSDVLEWMVQVCFIGNIIVVGCLPCVHISSFLITNQYAYIVILSTTSKLEKKENNLLKFRHLFVANLNDFADISAICNI